MSVEAIGRKFSVKPKRRDSHKTCFYWCPHAMAASKKLIVMKAQEDITIF